MKRPLAISLSPNLENKDVLYTLGVLFSPTHYKKGNSVKLLEQWFKNYFSMSHAVSFNSGRAALFAILKALDIQKGDEVILQSFTCVAVPNAVIWVGAKPIYADITDELTIDTRDLEKKISKKTKAIIVQHTFGIPTDMIAVNKIAKKHNLLVIEDCAHTIGAKYQEKLLGQLSDVAFFSFGRDKAFSSVFGGMAITNNKKIGEKLLEFQNQQECPSIIWILQQLFHPLAFSVILPLYDAGNIGKIILVTLQKLHILSFPVLPLEKKANKNALFVKKLPNALAALALFQLKRIKEFNTVRQDTSRIYSEKLSTFYKTLYNQKNPLLRFPVLVDNKEKLISYLKHHKIYIGNWYSSIVDPNGVSFEDIFYKKTSCPRAEFIAGKIINLPTYPTLSSNDQKKIIQLLNTYGNK